jgi:arylsulfatase A-like enzyme
MNTVQSSALISIGALLLSSNLLYSKSHSSKPNIILVMSDDQGWGQTGYYNHPVLRTPNLDDMAAHGLRLDRFYAGAPVCSPTRASVLTGRSNDRTAVYSHGYPMRRQEKTVAQALKKVGYNTAHFGKWHLDGFTGPGVPVLEGDNRHPGHFGFDEWLSVTNFFDMDPVMSRKGKFEELKGGSSEVIVNEALKYMLMIKEKDEPFFVAIWYGSPHNPWKASDEDKKSFKALNQEAQNHYGELVDMDRSIGALRKGLQDIGIAENTLVWFNSDNGGLKNFGPETVGGLRGFKSQVYEGGLRVPCVIEWPAVIKTARSTEFPAVTMDIFPTIAEIVGLRKSDMIDPIDGISLRGLFEAEIGLRKTPIPFRYMGKGALVDNNYKLVSLNIKEDKYELYNLKEDPKEQNNLVLTEPKIARKMIEAYNTWNHSVESSIAGKDFQGGLIETDPQPRPWMNSPEYKPYLEELTKRIKNLSDF